MKPLPLALTSLALLGLGRSVPAQGYDEALFRSLKWRLVGPFRGGRSAAVCGLPADGRTYYMGACGGGVWKTTDAGRTWKNVSDGFFGGSIGAVAVSPSDPNVVYAGGGEVTVRGNVSHGYGVFRSTDAGRTWKQVGLSEARHIPRLRIHPKDPDLVYAAVLGHLFGPSEQRGVFRSTNGGRSWERVLFANRDAGAVDLCFDPTNPRILYASTWRVRRTPWSLESGGEGSALWKSRDGGDTWTELTKHDGMPGGTLGIIGVAVSPAKPDRVWAIVEAAEGGVFRSEDGGATWKKVNSDRSLRQRAWYYTRIYADPKDADVCYVLNVRFWRSKDGGKTFSSIRVPHGDNHDLWIAPGDPLRMIEANDGGANVSLDGGRTWSRLDNQPTAQFYRVTTDSHFPYRIYGAQQDNSTVRIASRSMRGSITDRDWEPTAGGESGHIAPHPTDPEIVFGGSYGGHLARVDHRSGARRLVNVWPDNPMGWGAADLTYRFQWNFPIFFSPHGPYPLYAAANVLFRSTDEGQSWQRVSPDLTRHDRSKMGPSGGPITKDNTSVEYYGTIFAACESPRAPGVLWCGSDDGLVHVSRDAGKTWTNVTPPGMPEWAQVNSLEAHPFEDGGVYVAATSYKSDDFRPYLFVTTDYGATWNKITGGIPDTEFTRVVRADPRRRGLLYAGTEAGVWVSFDDGRRWQPLQLGLPVVPITDLSVKEGDLVAATQGRAFWVLDDLSPLRQLSAKVAAADVWLFRPRRTYRVGGGGGRRRGATTGENPPQGVLLSFWLRDEPAGPVSLDILDAADRPIRTFSTAAKDKEGKLEARRGANRFVWDLRYPGARKVAGMVLWGGSTRGPRAVPGTYRARLTAAGRTLAVPFEIVRDPRSPATQADLAAQFDFLIGLRDDLSRAHEAILDLRSVRTQVEGVVGRAGKAGGGKEVAAAAKSLLAELGSIEEALYQTKNRSPQDPLNFPIRLNNKVAALAGVVATGDYRPTRQAEEVRRRLVSRIDAQLRKLDEVVGKELPAFNDLVRGKGIPAVVLERAAGRGDGK